MVNWKGIKFDLLTKKQIPKWTVIWLLLTSNDMDMFQILLWKSIKQNDLLHNF